MGQLDPDHPIDGLYVFDGRQVTRGDCNPMTTGIGVLALEDA
ncbi:MAG TPA: hypothetical protein VHD15_18000 [Hyphomicrobiales bacterium]|nr:hypothetical protein [Hyphomicrobiales bacterium]